MQPVNGFFVVTRAERREDPANPTVRGGG